MKTGYDTIEEAYKDSVKYLTAYATKYLRSKDLALDAVQEAFVKVQEYVNKNPGKKIKSFILFKLVFRVCKRFNKEKDARNETYESESEID